MGLNCISSLKELVETLKNSEPKAYVGIADRLDIPVAELIEYTHWEDDAYTRNLIERTDNFELMLICWSPGVSTPIHCHDEQRCWVYQLSGKMEEVIYGEDTGETPVPKLRRMLKSGDVYFMEEAKGFHSLHNSTDTPSLSLHLYAKPIDSCTCYDSDSEKFVPKQMSYHSIKGELVVEQIATAETAR